MTTAVTLENVTVSYSRHPAVHHVSGSFAAGSLTAIAGPNGGGKSTLLKAIAGIMPTDEGRIRIEGDARRIAYLAQAAQLPREFPLTVLHLVAMGAWQQKGGMKAMDASVRQKALAALGDVGLAGFDGRDLASLSAGQFQRALFARLILQDAPLILLDEPFTAMDATTTVHLFEIIARWHREKRTVICVLHDFDQIREHFPDCLLLARECITWQNTLKALQPEFLKQVRFFGDHRSAHSDVCSEAV